jgi:hypothetical protein
VLCAVLPVIVAIVRARGACGRVQRSKMSHEGGPVLFAGQERSTPVGLAHVGPHWRHAVGPS